MLRYVISTPALVPETLINTYLNFRNRLIEVRCQKWKMYALNIPQLLRRFRN
jgi:hypothetical protein